MTGPLTAERIATHNEPRTDELARDYDALGEQLSRRGISIETVTANAARLAVALPSWGVGTGGTRFGRFPGPGEPRHIFDKVDDCATVHALTRITPEVSPHFPWDTVEDYGELRQHAEERGLTFGPINSNTFQDQPGQAHSYKFGSLTHTEEATRDQAIAHNLECIRIGEILGAKSLTVWLADGSNFPGQASLTGAFERYLASMGRIYDALPDDWLVFIEHKMFEPAFYATVIQDWGSSLMAAQSLGEKARCLVDLGHHAPNVNIEMIVARLLHAGKLGGFHFNDSKYGDDDLDAGSQNPFRQFLIFNELVEAETREGAGFAPAYMLDQSHNVTDPIESLMISATAVQRSYVQALLVDREALRHHQHANDALMANLTLRMAFETAVTPILAEARRRAGGAIDPLACYRESGYRAAKAKERPLQQTGGSGIV